MLDLLRQIRGAVQIKQAVTKGLAGANTTSSDVDGNCAATFGD